METLGSESWAYTSGQNMYSDDVTEATSQQRAIMSLCTILYTDSTREVACSVTFRLLGKLEFFTISKRMKEKQHKKSIYIVWFYLIIIYDVNSFKVQWCGKPCILPFQAWIPALPLPVSALQSQSPLSSTEKIIPTP